MIYNFQTFCLTLRGIPVNPTGNTCQPYGVYQSTLRGTLVNPTGNKREPYGEHEQSRGTTMRRETVLDLGHNIESSSIH